MSREYTAKFGTVATHSFVESISNKEFPLLTGTRKYNDFVRILSTNHGDDLRVWVFRDHISLI
jgi:hypothetical protein